MKNRILTNGVLILLIFIFLGCKNKKITEFEGYALLNYNRFEDRKQIEVIPLDNYDVRTSLEGYIIQQDTLNILFTYVSSCNLSYYKMLDKNTQKKGNSDVLYSLVRIKYSFTNLALEWSKKEKGILQISNIRKPSKNLIVTDWNDKNKFTISSIEYLPLILEKKL